MKELSTEEKAKRYDEAIEIARQIHDADRVSGTELTTCEEIFPELTESEDERIRKELLTLVKQRPAGFPNYKKYIAWLEKQGEITKEWYEMKINRIQTELQEMVKLKQKTEQGEQKPTEKTKIYDSMDDLIADALIEEIESSELDDRGKYNRIHWIKSHRQKPAWSEEDEKMLNDIIKDLVHPWNEYIPDRIEEEIKWLKNWLKSLRPQSRWKPSDEQIEALSTLANIPESASDTWKKATQELLEQLKKLKGKSYEKY